MMAKVRSVGAIWVYIPLHEVEDIQEAAEDPEAVIIQTATDRLGRFAITEGHELVPDTVKEAPRNEFNPHGPEGRYFVARTIAKEVTDGVEE